MIDNPRLYCFSVVFLFLSGLFSASETALKAAGRPQLQEFAARPGLLGSCAGWVLEYQAHVRLTLLFADTLANVVVAVMVSHAAFLHFGSWGAWGALAAVTVFVVIFGELIPRCAGILLGERFFPVALPLLRCCGWLLNPLNKGMARFVQAGPLTVDGALVTKDEIERVVKSGEDSGALEAVERRMIHGVISFEELRVSEIMVPRTDIDLLEAQTTIEEAMPLIEEWEHSRIPVYRETPDDILGILYVKDLIPQLHAGRSEKPISDLLRKALFVPETMKVSDLFEIMKRDRIHLAIVVDEYGGTAGIVSLEDLLEEIVGEIQDEYDEEEPDVVQITEDTWRVQTGIGLDDLSEALGYPFHGDDVETVAGYILEMFGDFPKKGDSLMDAPWVITVTSVKNHRIMEATFRRLRLSDSDESAGQPDGAVDKEVKSS